ncbi:MAG: biotin--[acetyl-CoA-carboxylase] ligase [Lachnospiraceae bacterium]|nr:biotin--[acetyl-CoA-carboxylase] ligase [Lachnospiraceae bacterium]
MTGKQELFVLLQEKQGTYISGEELAGRLHSSRNAVWKAVCALRKEGHQIDAVTKKGYCLRMPANRITEGEICAALAKDGLMRSVEVLEETDSTNRVAKEQAQKGAAEGTLFVAKRQSMGKGRFGRSFFAPEGGIYMSAVLRPEIPADRAVFITTCAAVAVARAIEKETGIKTGIKWVNDIFIDGKKVCGISTEAALDLESGIPEYVILGIGINIEKQALPEDLKGIVACLEEYTKNPVEKSRLIAAVWNEFSGLYKKLGAAEYMKEYKERSVLLGREVTVFSAQGSYSAVVRDIDGEGRLLVEHEGVVRTLFSGEVSVKILNKEEE